MDQFDRFSRIMANRRITALISTFYLNDLTEQSRQILAAQLTGVPVTVIAGRLNMTSTQVCRESQTARLMIKRSLLTEGVRVDEIAHLFIDPR